MRQIDKVTPKANYMLEVLLDNGNSVILDFTSRVTTVRFSLLREKTFFCKVTTDGTCVRWGNDIEVSLA